VRYHVREFAKTKLRRLLANMTKRKNFRRTIERLGERGFLGRIRPENTAARALIRCLLRASRLEEIAKCRYVRRPPRIVSVTIRFAATDFSFGTEEHANTETTSSRWHR
jgi:hypothetical protein